MKTLIIGNRVARALFFLDSGQRCETWLPSGIYDVGNEVYIGDSKAITLHRRNGETYYVSPENAFIKGLLCV